MSQIIGKELTDLLFERMSGNDISAHEGKIIPIMTVDERGWAHPALLSYYEVVAKSPAWLDMALWKNSSTANHLRSTGKVTLMIIDRGVNYYIKGNVSESETEMPGAAVVSRFRVDIEALIEDQEPNAQITSGMTYSRLTQRETTDFAAKVFRLLRETQ